MIEWVFVIIIEPSFFRDGLVSKTPMPSYEECRNAVDAVASNSSKDTVITYCQPLKKVK